MIPNYKYEYTEEIPDLYNILIFSTCHINITEITANN